MAAGQDVTGKALLLHLLLKNKVWIIGKWEETAGQIHLFQADFVLYVVK